MTYSTTKFEVATSNGLGGDTFTRNVTDGRTHGRTDGRRTDFDTKLIYPFFLKKKAGIITILWCLGCTLCLDISFSFMPEKAWASKEVQRSIRAVNRGNQVYNLSKLDNV